MHTAAAEQVGYRRQQKSTWFDEECRQAAIEKNHAYQATLMSAATRAVCEKYREKRRTEFHRKKPEFVTAKCEQMEMHGSRNDARKFFQNIKHMSEGFKTEASFCKDQDGNSLTDIKSSLDLWRALFNAILNGDDTNNFGHEMIRSSRPNTLDDAAPVAQLDREEVAIAIQRLKFNKASGYDGLPAELLKQEEISWFAACTTFAATYGHWKADQVIGVLVCSAQFSKRALSQSAAIIVA